MSTGSNQPSTIQSIIDSASATVQSVVGTITGNPADKREAEARHNHATAEHELSKAGASVGPLNISASGVTVDNEDRTQGKKDQTIGSGKEFVGNLFGNDSLTREGKQQNASGEGQEAFGQVKNYVGGAADRVTGTIGAAAANLVGNKDAQASYQHQHDAGKTNVRGVESELK